MHDIDPNTGLPALPEGYYWRIVKTSDGSNYVNIEMRRRHTYNKSNWLGGETTVFSEERIAYTCLEYIETTKEKIISRADYILRTKYNPWETPDTSEIDSLLGDYPPNSL